MASTVNAEQIEAAVKLGKDQIIGHLYDGTVPARRIHTFADLHDYVDANMYGVTDANSPMSSEDMDFWNEVQERLAKWIENWTVTGLFMVDGVDGLWTLDEMLEANSEGLTETEIGQLKTLQASEAMSCGGGAFAEMTILREF